MADETESTRRQMVGDINSNPADRQTLEEEYGKVWGTAELSEDFEVLGFLAPYVVVRRKSDGMKGSLLFQDSPRLYFSFDPN